MKKDSKRRLVKIGGILFTILMIFIFIESFIFREKLALILQGEVQAYGTLMIFFISMLMDLLPQYISPHAFLIQHNLIGFPLPLLLLATIVGSTFGSIIGFLLGRKLGKKFVTSIYKEKDYNRLRNKVSSHGKWVMAIAAVSPIPYLPLVFGALGISKRDFLFYGLIPRVLGFLILAIFLI